MELLLNLAWLLLALPACWLWRARKRLAAHRPSPLQFLLTLGCMLVILFPVISATDDLCAMRAEFEESPAGKYSIRQSPHERLSASKWQTHPALLATPEIFYVSDEAWLRRSAASPSTVAAHTYFLPARAPPASLLG